MASPVYFTYVYSDSIGNEFTEHGTLADLREYLRDLKRDNEGDTSVSIEVFYGKPVALAKDTEGNIFISDAEVPEGSEPKYVCISNPPGSDIKPIDQYIFG